MDLTRKARFEIKTHAAFPGCWTLDDYSHMVDVLTKEGVPGDARAGLYADREGTVVFNHVEDGTARLKAILETLRAYVYTSGTDTGFANDEEVLIVRLDEILETL